MSLPSQKRPTQRSNPFEIFGTPPAPAHRPVSNHHRLPQSKSHVRSKNKTSSAAPAAIQPRPLPVSQKKPFINLKSLFYLVISGLILFSFLPMPVQKRLLSGIGLSVPSLVQINPPLPVDYDYISSPFGKRWGRQHQGIDFAAPLGAPIYAASAGKVIHSGWESGYGNSIVIDHGQGRRTRYAHCSKLLAKVGQAVTKGLQIAKIGSTGHSTGPHLHFEVIVNGIHKNPAWFYSFTADSSVQVAQADSD